MKAVEIFLIIFDQVWSPCLHTINILQYDNGFYNKIFNFYNKIFDFYNKIYDFIWKYYIFCRFYLYTVNTFETNSAIIPIGYEYNNACFLFENELCACSPPL